MAQPEDVSLTAAVILIDRLDYSLGGERGSELFAQSPACQFGVDGVRFVTAEVESDGGLERWRRFLFKNAIPRPGSGSSAADRRYVSSSGPRTGSLH